MTGLSKSISCFDRIFNEASCDKYYLSIRMCPDGLFYSVYDPAENKYIGFESALLAGTSEIYKYISEHSFLTGKFAKKTCIFPAPKYTLIPATLFIEGKEAEYFDFSHQRSAQDVIGVCGLIGDEAKMIYAADISWSQIMKDHFHEALRYPAAAAFIDTMVLWFRTSRTSVIFINIYEENFDLLILEEGNLKYCNNFYYKSEQDLVYYTIFVFDQLKINAEKIDLRLSGNINEKSGIIRLLRKYIRNVAILEPRDVRLSYALNDIPLHAFPDLFNPRLCEL